MQLRVRTADESAAATRPTAGSGPKRKVGPGFRRMPGIALALLYGFTVVAVAGYAVYGRDPSRLVGLPEWAVAFYGRSFGLFARGHVWLAFAVLAAVLVVRAGGRWLAAFAGVYAISLASELAGTTCGVPFGAYAYS